MIFYSTNYSTKLDAPLWKRAALMRAVFDGITTEKHAEEQVDSPEVGGEQLQRKNNKTRQFLARTANEEAEEGLTVGSTWRPREIEMRFTLYDLLASKREGGSIIQGSHSLKSLVEKLQKAGFSESTTLPSQDQGHRIWSQTELDLPKPTVNMIKAAQLRLHKEKVLAIEGDDETEATG
jgi:hypothetical protein